MSDIFISYSSRDREKAEQLTELLASAGLSVWIDKKSLEISSSWSGEIADAIEQCKAFIILLSPDSAVSVNVAKEVSLASHYKKKILPLDLEPVELSRDLAYHLAGLHRAPMTNIDAIIRAIGTLGLEATQAPTMKIVKETDGRKSLMILPFEDLSPTADNGWFADGIVSELIDALSNVKSLRLANNQATKEFKGYHGQLSTYAKTMSIRYFVQGDVRKFGDNIKVSSRLLDIESGDHLWQDSLKGTMDDIFDIQEKVAERVVDGLRIYLGDDEKDKLAKRGTENAEAYELCMRGRDYFNRQTKEGFTLSAQLSADAIRLDPTYAEAYYSKAIALIQLYRNYDRTSSLLDEAETLCKEALRLRPDRFAVYDPLSQIYKHRGQLHEAEEAVKEFVKNAPLSSHSHFALGFFYGSINQYIKAIASYERAVQIDPEHVIAIDNLVSMCDTAGETESCRRWASVALPFAERSRKLRPDDESKRVGYAIMLLMSGHPEQALAEATLLRDLKDAHCLYNTACLFSKLGDRVQALYVLRKAIEAGLKNIAMLKEFLADEKEGIIDLVGTPEYEEVKRMVEQVEAEEEAKNNV